MACSTKTTCPYCGVGCGILATPKKDGTVEIKGDETHPANFGRLCSKGFALGETLDMDGRLLEPEVDGEKSSWEVALQHVADTFNETIRKHGPDSVAFYVSGQILTEDYYVANKLMKGFIGSGNIDTNSRLCMASSVAGHRRAFGADTVPGTYEDLELADVVVLVGSNLAWCHPVIYQRIAAAKAARPSMKIVLVDPRRTMTADIADMHLPIATDGDAALFAGLLSYLAKRELIDGDYVAKHTKGFSEALGRAQSLPLEETATLSGLSTQELQDFYALWASNQKVVTVYSQGVNQSCIGTDKVNAIINCHLATGRIGKPGMGPFSITGQPNAMGGREVGGLANMLAAHMEIENPDHRDRVKRYWNAPRIADKPGLKAVDMFEAVSDGRIKAIWIMATNPVDSMPDADVVEAALQACPFVVVSDVLAQTDTVRHAHVKLPSLGWGEKDGTVTNSERRISHQKAFLPAPGYAKADWWQMAQVALRMGYGDAFNYNSASEIFREYAAQTAFENDGTRDLDIGAYADVSDTEYDNLLPFQWPAPKAANWEGEDKRFFANGGFYTVDQKAQFVAVNPRFQLQHELSFPFVLNTGRIRDQWHTMTRTGKSARLLSHIAEPFAEIHPQDAALKGIADAAIVTVRNARGRIAVRALLTNRVQQGHIFVPMHFTNQVSSNARVDKLIAPITDPFSGQPALKSDKVDIETFETKQFGFVVSRKKPALEQLPYWALAPALSGWRAEFASDKPIEELEAFACSVFGLPSGFPLLVFKDHHSGLVRAAAFDGEHLVGALYLASTPVIVSRSWAVEQLSQNFSDLASRWQVVAGRPSEDMPDKGAIICSCMNVGVNDIAQAVQNGNRTVEMVGKSTCAGTNCGSCKSEIKAIINEHQLIAAE